MHRIRLAIAILSLIGCQPTAGFIEGSTIGVVAHSPTQFPVIFFNSHTGVGLEKFPENEWSTVDLAALIPSDARAVHLSGLLIVTHGAAEEICDLTVAYRNHGETSDPQYLAQTIETSVNGGQRTPHSIWVPITGKKFQLKWHRSTGGSWPEHCAYGVNLNLIAYLR